MMTPRPSLSEKLMPSDILPFTTHSKRAPEEDYTNKKRKGKIVILIMHIACHNIYIYIYAYICLPQSLRHNRAALILLDRCPAVP